MAFIIDHAASDEDWRTLASTLNVDLITA